jgi:adenylate cyclase
MNQPGGAPESDEEFWRKFLMEGDPKELAARRFFRWLPHGPRCGLCLAPFAGVGAPLMRAIGKRPSQQSPTVCTSCFTHLADHHGGAHVVMTFLFADVRGSTTLAERMSADEYRRLLDRFYRTAADAIFGADGAIDKFVGDEVVAFFIPAFVPAGHARRAVEAAVALLRATGHGDPDGPWIPVGAGVHTGLAWMGAVGEGARTDLTALGDTVNTTARLASEARAGEVLVSTSAAAAAGLDTTNLERRSLELKGKTEATEVVTLTVSTGLVLQ